jgi:ATP:ADP antiporter, AAA family
VAIYRGGDAVWASAFALLTDGVGLGMAAMAGIGAGIAAVWGATGIYLGRKFDRAGKGDAAEIAAKNPVLIEA